MATQFAVPQALVHAEATPEVSSARAGEQYTPMVASVLSTPRWFAGSDGQAHLTLEMRVLNAFSVDVKLTELTVLDGGNQTRSRRTVEKISARSPRCSACPQPPR